jgi:hypothetical protein
MLRGEIKEPQVSLGLAHVDDGRGSAMNDEAIDVLWWMAE